MRVRRKKLQIAVAILLSLVVAVGVLTISSSTGTTPTTTGNSNSKDLTVTPDLFALNITNALLKDSPEGVNPIVDCGTKDIKLVENKIVHCDIKVQGSDVIYDSTNKIVNLKAIDDYGIDIQVSSTPKK